MRLSYSQFRTFGECPRRWVLSRRWEPKVTAAPLSEGDVFHAALGKYYSGAKFEDVLELQAVLGKSIIDSLEEGSAMREKMMLKMRALKHVLEYYLRRVGESDRAEFDFLHTEEEICFEVTPGVEVLGYIDGIWKHRRSGVRYIVEHKYKLMHEDALMPLDLQISVYTLGLLERFGRLPTLYNVARKVQLRPSSKGSESLDAYGGRVLTSIDKAVADFEYRPERFDSRYFVRHGYSRGQADLRVAVDQMRSMAEQMRRVREDESLAWRNVGDHCLWGCPFMKICIEEDAFLTDRFYTERVGGEAVRK